MRARQATRATWLLAILAGAASCSFQLKRTPRPPDPHSSVYVEPTGDGSHYVEVVSQPTAPPQAVRGKWKRAATRACEGDYIVMSEYASERRSGSFVEGRVYEGWVRCLSPEVAIDSVQDDASRAGAKADENAAAAATAPPRRTRFLPRLGG